MSENQSYKIIITGAAGFIGFHLANRLISIGHKVLGIDNFDEFYDSNYKETRWNLLKKSNLFEGKILDIANNDGLLTKFKEFSPSLVIHLAARPGVRQGFDDPLSYTKSNLIGMANILECCRQIKISHLIYASSSSVYGNNSKTPSNESHSTNELLSFYAATKSANESMAQAFSNLYDMPITGLRFFTVYGPWGRPDMAMFKFTESIFSGTPITLYGNGEVSRDFTYIDDAIESIIRIIHQKSKIIINQETDKFTHDLINIGNGKSIRIIDLVKTIETVAGLKADIRFKPIQPGEAESTWCDNSKLNEITNYRPLVSIEEGVSNFINWYRNFFNL